MIFGNPTSGTTPPRDGQMAMAINFRDQHATHVEFFTPPDRN